MLSDPVQIALIQAAAVGFPAIIAAIFSYLGLKQSRETHNQVNSRMTEMLEMQRIKSEAFGVKKEADREKPVV